MYSLLNLFLNIYVYSIQNHYTLIKLNVNLHTHTQSEIESQMPLITLCHALAITVNVTKELELNVDVWCCRPWSFDELSVGVLVLECCDVVSPWLGSYCSLACIVRMCILRIKKNLTKVPMNYIFPF